MGRISSWLCIGVAVCGGAGSARAQAAWVNHVQPSLVSEIVHRNGELYIASGGGLLIYDVADSTFRQFTNTIGLPSNFLTCLAFDPNGSIYVGTDAVGISRLDFVAGGFQASNLNATFHGLSDDRITSLAAWGDTIAYGTKQGAGLIVKGFPSVRFLVKDGLPSEVISDVLADGSYLWFATNNGVARLDRFGFISTLSAGLPSLDAHVFARDDTTLWVGTAAGLARFDASAGGWIPAGLGTESVFSIAFDGLKLWAASYARLWENGGSGWLERGNFFFIFPKYGVNFLAEPKALQPMPDGSVYLGISDASAHNGGFLMVYDGVRVYDKPTNAPPAYRLVRTAFDVDGSLWVSSDNFGVGKLTPSGAWFNYTPAVGDTHLTSRFQNLALLPDSKGVKWFCSLWTPPLPVVIDELRDGLDRSYANDVWVHHDIGSGGGDGLGSLRNQRAFEDPAGNRWFLSDIDPGGEAPPSWKGISILSEDRSAWRHVNPTSTGVGGMPLGNLTSVAFGSAGVTWVADREYGVLEWRTGGYDQATLFDLAPDQWITVGTSGGDFEGGDVMALALRGDGVLWVGTTEGVFKLENGAFKGIGFDEGLLSNLVLDLALDHDENLWAATSLGLCRIARDDDAIRSFTTPVVWQTQLSLLFPPDVVSPIAEALCHDLAMHPTKDLLCIATAGGLSILDLTSLEPSTTGLSRVYVFPNPIRTRRGHSSLKIANHDRLVDVEIYTQEGELIHRENDVAAGEEIVWDLTTEAGYLAASGVYVVRIRAGGETVVRTVSLIR
jgi:hypothetical protein